MKGREKPHVTKCTEMMNNSNCAGSCTDTSLMVCDLEKFRLLQSSFTDEMMIRCIWLTDKQSTGRRVLLEKQTVSEPMKKLPTFYGTHSSLPSSKQPAPCPFSLFRLTTHAIQSHFFKIHFNNITPPTPRSYKFWLSFRFHLSKILFAFTFSPMLHALPISRSLIWYPNSI